jgi:transposase InsO family protein
MTADAAKRIRAIHSRSRKPCETPRIRAELVQGRDWGGPPDAGSRIAGDQSTRMTIRDKKVRGIPDLMKRGLLVIAPNRLWVADIMYIPPWAASLLYSVVAMDVFFRRNVG